MEIKLPPRRIAKYLAITIGLLAIGHVVSVLSMIILGLTNKDLGGMPKIVALFHLDHEQNLPTMYSVAALLFSALLLFVISYVKRNGEYFHNWIFLAAIFLFLALDEFSSIHEEFAPIVRVALDTSGFFYQAWIIPYAIGAFAILLLYIKFLINLPTKFSVLFCLSGFLFILGAIGFEALGAYRYEQAGGSYNALYQIFSMSEELLEMIGIGLFIYTLLSYIDEELKGVSLKISSS